MKIGTKLPGVIALLLVVTMIGAAGGAGQALAASDSISFEQPTVIIDGTVLQSDVPAVMVNNRIVVPMRAVFEELGATVSWNELTETVKAVKGDVVIILPLNGVASVNDQLVSLDVPAQIMNDRVMVPLRFVAEAMGCQVQWDDQSLTASISRIVPPAPPVVQPGSFAGTWHCDYWDGDLDIQSGRFPGAVFQFTELGDQIEGLAWPPVPPEVAMTGSQIAGVAQGTWVWHKFDGSERSGQWRATMAADGGSMVMEWKEDLYGEWVKRTLRPGGDVLYSTQP